jgi:hypothetical protein
MVLVIGGLITNQIGVAMTGTAILGALLGAAGVKYQPQLQLALCKIGFHKWERSIDGNWVNKWCKKCYTTKRRRIV